MTAGARTDDLEMVHGKDWLPCVTAVTVFTYIRGVDVIKTLTILDGAVMAADAVAHDAFMAECCWEPGIRGVAIVAFRNRG